MKRIELEAQRTGRQGGLWLCLQRTQSQTTVSKAVRDSSLKARVGGGSGSEAVVCGVARRETSLRSSDVTSDEKSENVQSSS